jgi:oligoendopeptidase F
MKKQKWNLKLLYSSPTDPQIEKDVVELERLYTVFAKKYDTPKKKYLSDTQILLIALTDYEKLLGKSSGKPLMYFHYLSHMDSRNTKATSQISLFSNRLTHAGNKVLFFEISLGTIIAAQQKKILSDKNLAHFRVLLERIFSDATHTLSIPEEKIMGLKSIPSHDMWVMAFGRNLNEQTVMWKGKRVPLPEAQNMILSLSTPDERRNLNTAISETLKKVSSFSEAEINAVVTNKKINDELRRFKTPYESTVQSYRNDPKVVEQLVAAVSAANPVAQRFYALKARLLKQKKLSYSDRGAKIGTIKKTFSFEQSGDMLRNIFGSLDTKFADILGRYLKNGQIDAFPRIGKMGGAYCSSSYGEPTFVLLNHVDTLGSFSTFAHEMGHAFHSELSEFQGSIYSNYSTALAETASTLFESIALESVFDSLSDAEKIIVLHDKINDDISTIFRQIACFNFEQEIHATVKEKGFISKEALAELHNKHMKAYLGPVFDLTNDDGYFWVSWSHIRNFFYVYSYAYGMLVSKALLRRYHADKSFWKKIEQFLAAGGKDSPENILREIGIDVSKAEFWKESLKEIEKDIMRLEELTA